MLVADFRSLRGGLASPLGEALRASAECETRLLIQIRDSEITPRELRKNLREIRELPESARGVFLLNGATLQNAWRDDENIARQVLEQCDGVHWPERFLKDENFREYSRGEIGGVSIHSADAAQRASTRGFCYALFGAIYQTATHPGAAGVGLEALRDVCEKSPLPIFAIGGIDAKNAARVLAAGAHGIAVKSALWNAPNIGDATRELCEIVRYAKPISEN